MLEMVKYLTPKERKMIQIIRTKGYEYLNGKKFILLPVKKEDRFKGIVIGDSRYSGTFISPKTPAKKVMVQYRLDDTIYPFSEMEAKSGDIFKHKGNYYMWTAFCVVKDTKLIYDFKKKRLVDFTSLDINYPMTMVKLKVCGDNNIKSKSIQRREAVQKGE